MGTSEDKSALLNALKIERNVSEPKGYTLFQLVWVVVGTAVLVTALMLFFMPSEQVVISGTEVQKADSAPIAPIQPVKYANSEEVLNASGYITARRIATVSSEVMGLITAVEVEEGMYVQEEQVLATLDSAVADIGLALAQARVEVLKTRIRSAETELDEAKRVSLRVTELGKESFSSEAQQTRAQADLDKSTSLLASATADLQVALLQVQQQQELLNNHIIRAPFSGVVTVKNAQPGEIVAPSSAGGGFTRTGICTIVDMDSLEIEVDVNEAFIGRVRPEQRVKANLDAYPDWDIPASVIAIIPTANRAKATVSVRIKIAEKDPRILPDMGVKVAFLKENSDN